MPDVLVLVLVFWSVHQPLRVGIGVAFFFGLCMDVHQAALLGQHALAYTALSFFAITIHRRLLWFSVPSQALQVLPLFVAAHAIELGIRMLGGGVFPGWQMLLAPLIEVRLWPHRQRAAAGAAAPRRPTPDANEHAVSRLLTRSQLCCMTECATSSRARAFSPARAGRRPGGAGRVRAAGRAPGVTCRSCATTIWPSRPRAIAPRSCRWCRTAG